MIDDDVSALPHSSSTIKRPARTRLTLIAIGMGVLVMINIFTQHNASFIFAAVAYVRAENVTEVITPCTTTLAVEPEAAARLRRSGSNSSTSTMAKKEFKANPNNNQEQHLMVFTAFAGGVQEGYLLSLAFARYANPFTEIIVLTHNATAWSEGHVGVLVQQQQLNVKVHTVSPDPRISKLESVYKHSSVNLKAFELACITRFILVDAFVTNYQKQITTKVASVSMLDLDIVVFAGDKPQRFYPPVQASALHRTSSFFARFSPVALHEFANFALKVYDRKDNMETLSIIQRYGYLIPLHIGKLRNATSEWLPHELVHNNATVLKQFSDMTLFSAWLDDTNLETEIMFDQRKTPREYGVLTGIRQGLEEKDACLAGGAMFKKLQWKQLNATATSPYVRYQVRIRPSTQNSWGLHFQGSVCKAAMCRVLCSKLMDDHQKLIPCCAALTKKS